MPAVFTARCACCRRVRLRCQAPGLVSSRARRVGPPAAAGARRVRPLLLQSRPVPAAGGAQPLRRLLHHGIAGGGVRRRALDQAARLMDRQRHPLRPQGPYSTGCAAAAQRVFNPSVARRWWGSPSATRWSCKPSVARLRVRPTTCQQLHFFSVGNENGASAGRKPVRLLCQQNGNEADPGGPAVLRDQPERLRLALSPQRRGHAHAWARGGAHRDGRQQDHAQQRRVRHARDCPHLLRTPRACFSLPPSLSLPLSLPLSLSATSPTSVSDLVRDNHRRITRTVPPSCTSCSRSIAT